MKKRIVSALLALCLLASLGTLPAAAAGANTARTFSDVTDLDTAAEIESLQLLGADALLTASSLIINTMPTVVRPAPKEGVQTNGRLSK